MLRRLFLKRVSESLIIFAGIALASRWIKIGVVNNRDATAAARTFNEAIIDHRAGQTNLQKAYKKTSNEAWKRANEFYTEAHIQYYEAQKKYRGAHQAAMEANCSNLSTVARQYMKYCNHMEDACEIWAKAADLRIDGKTQKAKRQFKNGNEQRQIANSLVDTPIPKERATNDPTC